jgi:hypothetical protein
MYLEPFLLLVGILLSLGSWWGLLLIALTSPGLRSGSRSTLLIELKKALDVQVWGAEKIRAVIFQIRHRDFQSGVLS